MSFMKFPDPKDPDDVLDYAIDWTSRLDSSDTIVTSLYAIVDGGNGTVDGGIQIDSQSVEGNKSIVWLSGGIDNTTATIRCRITTQGGRQRDLTAQLKIKTK